MNGELKKLFIEAHLKEDYSGNAIDTFEVMYNPTTFSRKYEIEYHERQGQGDTGSPQIFKGIKPQDYSFDFVFDGTGVTGNKVNVADTIKRFLKVTGENNGEIHRSPYLKVVYGKLLVKCVLKSAEITYTLFEKDGSPLRAKVKMNVTGHVEDKERVAEARNSSPDLTHRRVIKQGDTLPLLTADIYGDETHFLQVAAFNNLKNFRKLNVGEILLFPPVKLNKT